MRSPWVIQVALHPMTHVPVRDTQRRDGERRRGKNWSEAAARNAGSHREPAEARRIPPEDPRGSAALPNALTVDSGPPAPGERIEFCCFSSAWLVGICFSSCRKPTHSLSQLPLQRGHRHATLLHQSDAPSQTNGDAHPGRDRGRGLRCLLQDGEDGSVAVWSSRSCQRSGCLPVSGIVGDDGADHCVWATGDSGSILNVGRRLGWFGVSLWLHKLQI